MSGPISSNKIEDVVTSLRRLVSVDGRLRPITRDLEQDRLVLTPEQRVVPEAAKTAPLILNTPVQEDVYEDPPAPTPQAESSVPESSEPDAAAASAYEAEWEEELWAEPDPPLSELALEAEEAEVVAEVAPEVLAADADLAAVADSPWAEVGDDWLNEEAPAPALAAAAAPVLKGDTGTTSESKGDAAPAPDKPDVLKLSAADMLTDGDGNPLTVLDEAALQQIIRQLIREELKGVLGERITQSVRKLVRAEINRALAAHALD